MLAHDMNRVSPVISVVTPFRSEGIRNELTKRGYELFLGEPRGLQVQIARDRRSTALIVGSFAQAEESHTINATLMDTESGEVIGTHSVTGSDWLTAVDELSSALLDNLEVAPSDNQSQRPYQPATSAIPWRR